MGEHVGRSMEEHPDASFPDVFVLPGMPGTRSVLRGDCGCIDTYRHALKVGAMREVEIECGVDLLHG